MMRSLFFMLFFLYSGSASASPRYLNFEAFGDVTVYGDARGGERLTIVLSDKTVSRQARDAAGQAIAEQGGLAVIVDVERYAAAINRNPESCAYHSWEFEKLSKFVQKAMGLPRYDPPILVGLGAGAALSYTTFTEAPRGTFAGLLVAGACPTFRMQKELCANEDESWSSTDKKSIARLEPIDKTDDAWFALPSAPESSCGAATTAEFFGQIDGVQVLPATTAKWGDAAWQAEVAVAVAKVRSNISSREIQNTDLADLPLHEEPAKPTPNKADAQTLAILLTGDGGWAGLDRDLADNLATAGVNVVGLNSLRFFWKKRTPDEIAQALSRVIEHYTQRWHAQNVILIGYSFGADVLPFAIRRLSNDDLKLVKAIALLAPGTQTDFEFKVGDWLGGDDDSDSLPVLPEILAMPSIPTLCAYGSEEESETLCPQVPASRASAYKTSGGHHFDGDFEKMAKAILALQAPRF